MDKTNERMSSTQEVGITEKANLASEEEAPSYVLIRSNVDSPWKDDEGKSYHYGNNVPNYKSIKPGTHFLMDRRFPDGKKIIARGRIGKVIEEKPDRSSIRATFDKYENLDPPTLITQDLEDLLVKLPGYNSQHSIHLLTKDIFESLVQPSHAWIFQANPAYYDIRSAVKELHEITFLVTCYKEEMLPGDRVYLWQSAPNAGIIAVGKLLDIPTMRPMPAEESAYVKDSSKFQGEHLRTRLRVERVLDQTLTGTDRFSS